MIKQYIIAYAATLITFLAVDAVWLGLVAKRFYAEQMGSLMRPDILFMPAAVFYLIFALGVVVLAIRPGQPELSLLSVAALGALTGFMAYGTYNFTNIATIKGWPISMSVVDLTWGTILTAVSAAAGAIVVRKVTG